MPDRKLFDSFGRIADDLRISVTDRCNFRCIYCMPAEGLKWLNREDILRYEEIVRLARIFVERYGVRTIRITGGEPLVRIKLEELIGMINAIDPTLDITMTTNGVLLRQKAMALKEAGLKRINISLDTLHMDRFHEMARSDAFERVMDGITAAREAGLWPIKLNMVVMKGRNDDEVVDFARLAHAEGYEVRFIEFMPLDGDNIWTNEQVVPSRRIQEQIEDQFPLVPFNDTRPGPATRFNFADGGAGGVGFISSVSQAFCTACNRIRLANEIRRELRPLTALLVKGEVSGMKQGNKGHYSFSIRDSQSLIGAFIYADDAKRLTTLPEDGQVFIFRGRVDYWAQYGTLRFIVDQVEFDDIGKLRAQLEELKRRLEAEGAFAAERKRRLPFLPRTVALLTSPTGAVIHDLQETIWERYPNMGIVVYPVQVQGAAAPMSVARALRRCNQERAADVIVLARGGGSFEEMYAFNTELVARAILDSKLPVVTALGHTSDRTVADLVGDAECRTPTEAGARVVPKKSDLIAQLRERERRLDREIAQRVSRETERIDLKRRRLLQVLPALVRHRMERLTRAAAELGRLSPVAQVARREEALRDRRRRLDSAAVSRLANSTSSLAARRAQDRLDRALAERFAVATRALAHREQRLVALSPDGVLARGYSITQDAASGDVIRSAAATGVDRRVRIRLGSGRLGARLREIQP